MKKKIDDYNIKQEKIKKLKEEQEERKKNEAIIMSQRRKEKENKNHMIKLKNDELIEERKVKLLNLIFITINFILLNN